MSVAVAGVTAAHVILLMGILAGTSAMALRHHAAATADSAALAGARAVLRHHPEQACHEARSVAAVSGARLTDCAITVMDVMVSVARETPFGPIAVSARAGPPRPPVQAR